MAKQPCRYFAAGKCRFGDACRFSHEATGKETSQGDARHRPRTADIHPLLKTWRFSIPKQSDRLRSTPLGDGALATFLDQTLQLIESSYENLQRVISDLATDAGLIRMRELLDRPYDTLSDDRLAATWEKLLLPYFKVLSHDNVLQSSVLEVRHATLLNDLYGVSGRQGANVFKAVARHLVAGVAEDELGISIAVLALMLEKNSSAKVNEEICAAAEVLVALLDLSKLDRATTRHLRTIKTALELGFEIPELVSKVAATKTNDIKPTFTLAQDMPGELSSQGPRHDNDFPDIRDIQILPTIEEVISPRSEYLPRENPSDWHIDGLPGLIDRQFRLVREDTVGQLRDAARVQLERLQNPLATISSEGQGARVYSYNNVMLEDVFFNDQKGLMFLFSFDQPQNLKGKSVTFRQEWWKESRRLGSESLICLLSTAGEATFLVVIGSDRDSKKVRSRYSLASDPLRAYVIAQVPGSDPGQTTRFLSRCTTQAVAARSIIEFPGVILPAFEPTLKALQSMANTLDLPFAEILLPTQNQISLPPPAYSLRNGFKFDLRSLLSDDERDDLQQNSGGERVPQALIDRSILDDAQRKAVKHALENSFTLIQGPPGTGKSFTGVKLIQTLLDNKREAKLGPIICVCYTNHALDQLLEHLVDAGVKQLIRIGSGSKSERLAAVNIRNVARNSSLTKVEGHSWGRAKESIKESSQVIGSALSRLDRMLSSDDETMSFLAKNYPQIHTEVMQFDVEDGWTKVTHDRSRSPLQQWLQAGPIKHPTGDLPLADLQNGLIPLAQMSPRERQTLHRFWLDTMTSSIHQDLKVHLTAFNEDNSTIVSLLGSVDLRILADASVIGVTTTGLARNLQHLRKLNSKILVVEEAGEVLEAHLLTAMLPSLEHAILIGDHQQLRPKVQNYELSVDNPRSRIALDVSLFERLVHPRVQGAQPLPFVTLETQRRMHPYISRLVHDTLYPNLQDADSVQQYPHVRGVRPRLFWLDHKNKEDAQNDNLHSTSHTNRWEVDMVVALVSHLQRQGVYASNDIAVLTPYLGQLRKLRRQLSSSAEIILNERDAEDLAHEESEEEEEEALPASAEAAMRRPSVSKGKLLQAVRLATVDNFQGEEAKVVVISLVRSNDQMKCGFLRTSNRINVLLSRAQHGMYIIGNSATTSNVPMWQGVINIFKSEANIGTTLELACPRHPDTPLQIHEPEDFARVAPEAGCDLLCGKQLPCGHSCPQKCHAEALHNSVYCLKDCNRPKTGCSHPCELPCGAECASRCDVVVQCNLTLPCGHVVSALPCWQLQDQSKIRCEVQVERKVSNCGHEVVVACHVSVDGPSYMCTAQCSASLECGHSCQKPCRDCRRDIKTGEVKNTDHGPCLQICGRDFNTCSHSCKEYCHPDEDCPPCSQPCVTSCIHSKCSKLCHEPCMPCTEEKCPSSCPHTACQMPCGAPCDWVPCSQRCQKTLSCGHLCPSICGEPCPAARYCQVCADEEILDVRVDIYTMETYAEVDLDQAPCLFLPCGHIFTMETLDGQMEMSTHYNTELSGDFEVPTSLKGDILPLSYEKIKTCPDCRGSLRSVARYGRIVRRSLLDESTKKFIIWSNRTYMPLADQLKEYQGDLSETVDEARLSGDIVLHGTKGIEHALRAKTGARYQPLLKLRTTIATFIQKVRKEEQPFQKVRDLVEAVRRRNQSDLPAFEFDQSILQTRGQLLAQALFIRCELVLLTDLVTVWEKLPQKLKDTAKLWLVLDKNRDDCNALMISAIKSAHVLQQAECHIFWAHFAALEITVLAHSHRSQMIEALQRAGNKHLDEAEAICNQYAGQTAPVSGEVSAIRKMLKTSVSSVSANELRMVVAAMATEFLGTGHWYRCANGHLFTIGECGMAMQLSRCPQCGAAVGGQHHRAAEGVTHARDIEEQFGQLRI
ncbi:uncharacterized protein MYCFIDRAFT_37116 [Pseudocercospora fijiensis CIRAD86]|uniref:Uncharacterized protein n=1 Tax=Pseudocercospora fijiensis (strain CIRAD86) TaxID=383855 RepID=M3A2C4_PSEFD|nr:uncharacterized protein MYCFIDRAFT_37116 [Pseudocercospora fijiensis CIRAD86]EME78551.1 hypothetical protein MYCFIDRAFT_37116 [Pseudocercospora fijiensis CIRAD86]